jgi:hypothetical protein
MSTAALEQARKKRAEMKAAGIPLEKLTPLERAKKNPKSTRAAINAKCWECEGGDADPYVNWRVGNCTCKDTCGLHAVRPYQKYAGAQPPKSLQV